MNVFARIATPIAVLAAVGLTATACAPSTSDNDAKKDDKSGTLRVWLFQEVNNEPKQKVVDQAVADFRAGHKDVKVDVTYIPIDTRAQKFKAAFNDPKSAPGLIEYGNTDTAGYVRDGGLADISKEFAGWPQNKDTDPTAKESVTVAGKTYGSPLFVGVRALYYRTDVFKDLGLKPPTTQQELISTAKKVRAERSDLYGLVVGGAYTYGALPFVWSNGGELATKEGGSYRSAIDSEQARGGIDVYASLFGDDNCPARKCAQMGGNDTIEAFASGKAGMAIGGDFNHQAVESSKVKGKYAVVPLPGKKAGEIAPAFAGGNNIGLLKSSSHRTLGLDLMQSLTSKKTQNSLFDAMGFLPTYTDVREEAAARRPFVAPFVRTLDAGAKFVPASPGWASIDAGLVLPTMFQQIVSGRKDTDAAAGEASQKMNDAFAEAS
ncbi:extracellular solute-binding protein [Streptomyces zagrosensis]|uniref:N,N'-diacetylchitobiose transport system substrate-binding protein n=1 Tax=Streptomyces zagrosensis TaxID=1042984 RepID=A0A7W9Q7X8_9ACTN|nr:extracellular solute-binding protein [Streptomyces zagrosensis]MBB5935258.1 N,N'-diacetylchitobiose transport system substrate-binding protein [Streptomyces zagrosensis]